MVLAQSHQLTLGIFYVTIFILVTSLIPISETKANSESSNDTFSIVQITDTQYLTWMNPSLNYATTEWVVNNSMNYNLKMVIHTGDLVDTPDHASEWSVANEAMMTLYNNGIPYCWSAGNHDQLPPNETANLWVGDSNTDWWGSQYPAFNQTIMSGQSHWVSDIFNGKNTAVAFDYQSYNFLIVNIEFLANSTVLEWMETQIKCNPNANVIVATHDYLNQTAGYGYGSTSNSGIVDYDWANNLRIILDRHPNVFMTMSGHIASRRGAHKQVGNRHETYFDLQESDNRTGAASIRIFSVNISSMQVDVSTYALNREIWLNDTYNQYNFSTSLRPYSPVTVNVENTRFYNSKGNHVTFLGNATLTSFSQYGDAITFNDLTLNGISMTFTVMTNGANMVMNSCDLNGWINYTVSESGYQTFYTNKAPALVLIDGVVISECWHYSNGVLTITPSQSTVAISFARPVVEPTTTSGTPTQSTEQNKTSTKDEPTPQPSSTANSNSTQSQANLISWLKTNWPIIFVLTIVALSAGLALGRRKL